MRRGGPEVTQSRDAEPPQSNAGPEGLDDEMARELLEHYLAGAAERLSSLEQALRSSEAHPADPAALEALRRVLHKTAGSAGTYGFPELTRSARRVEQGVAAARDAPPGAPALFAAARAFHAEMAEAFEQAARRLRGASAAVAEAPSSLAAAEEGVESLSSAVRERLVVAVIVAGAAGADDPATEAIGAALAAAGTHLLGSGPEDAARGYRRAGGEGLVLWIVPGARSSAARWIDLPLCASALHAQCAVAAAAADGAIVIGGGAEARAHCGFFLRERKPVVLLGAGPGAASMLAGRELDQTRVAAAAGAEEAVLELLTRLSAQASAR